MKHQALFSSKDKSKNNNSVICCNFARRFKGYNFIFSSPVKVQRAIVVTLALVWALTLKALNNNCSRRHFNFLLLSSEENKA